MLAPLRDCEEIAGIAGLTDGSVCPTLVRSPLHAHRRGGPHHAQQRHWLPEAPSTLSGEIQGCSKSAGRLGISRSAEHAGTAARAFVLATNSLPTGGTGAGSPRRPLDADIPRRARRRPQESRRLAAIPRPVLRLPRGRPSGVRQVLGEMGSDLPPSLQRPRKPVFPDPPGRTWEHAPCVRTDGIITVPVGTAVAKDE